MHLALKHQDQFVVLFGTEEHLVVLILILLYRSWNIKYIFYLSCYTINAINFFMQRDFLNVLIMFLQAILLLLAPSMRTLHRSPPSQFHAAHMLIQSAGYPHQQWIRQIPVSRHISSLKLEIFWQSVLPTILSPPFCRMQS